MNRSLKHIIAEIIRRERGRDGGAFDCDAVSERIVAAVREHGREIYEAAALERIGKLAMEGEGNGL